MPWTRARLPDMPGAIHDLTGGGAHVALDALGRAATARDALLALRRRGRHVQVGLLLGDESRSAACRWAA